jgi:hypothetical protein
MVHWRSFTGLALASLVALLVSGCTSGPAATNDPGNLSDRQASGTRATPARTYELCNDLDWCHVKEDDVPSLLRRSLHLPKLQPGEECPTSRGRHYATSDFGGTALGKGPVQPLIGTDREKDVAPAKSGVLRFRRHPDRPRWHSVKTLWFARPGYRGPAFIRGRHLDGSRKIVFGEAPSLVDPYLSPGRTTNMADGFREWPSRMAGAREWLTSSRYGSSVILPSGQQRRSVAGA